MHSREVIPLIQPVDLDLELPGSKSITNRAFLCAAIASGKSRVYGSLYSDDTEVMLNALNMMGVETRKTSEYIEISGTGGRFKQGKIKLDLGSSGTAMRFLTAIMYFRDGETIIRGDERMMQRPMKDLKKALEQLQQGKSKIRIIGSKSSQFISALLMLGPMLPAGIRIEVTDNLVSKPYVDTTIEVMKAFGVRVKNENYKLFTIKSQVYKSVDFRVEGDATAASYFSAIKYLHTGRLSFKNLNYAKSIQGDADFDKKLKELTDSELPTRIINMQEMPDSAMTLVICALFTKGTTKITGLSNLKYKETDRLKALQTELRKIGAKVKITKSSIQIKALITNDYESGNDSIPITTYNDHRMAMCFAVLGTVVPGIKIENPDCVSKTYPEFWVDLAKLYEGQINMKKKNIVLIGMRASGKTKYGKKMAKKLGCKFVDMDTEIENEEGIRIDEIVKKQGWPAFRKIEQKLCSKIYEKYPEPLVLATGGGVILNDKNMKNLKTNSVTVFLYADPHHIATRLSEHPKNRPSLTGEKLEKEIIGVWKERRKLYLKYADHVLLSGI